jgi:hypothetical protein
MLGAGCLMVSHFGAGCFHARKQPVLGSNYGCYRSELFWDWVLAGDCDQVKMGQARCGVNIEDLLFGLGLAAVGFEAFQDVEVVLTADNFVEE